MIEVVGDLNSKLGDNGVVDNAFVFMSTGFWSGILFGDHCLLDDETETLTEQEEKQDLCDVVLNRYNKWLEKIQIDEK